MAALRLAWIAGAAFLSGVAPAAALPAQLAGNTLVCPVGPGVTVFVYATGRSIFQVLSQSSNVGFLYTYGGSRNDRRPSGLAYTTIAQGTDNSLSLMATVTQAGGGVAAGTQLRSRFAQSGGAWSLDLTTVVGGQRANVQVACTLRPGRAMPQ